MKQVLNTLTAKVGNVLIGSGHPIAVQTMCNTHTFNEEDTIAQCVRMADAGVDIIRITVPGLQDVPHIKAITPRKRNFHPYCGGYPFFIGDGHCSGSIRG